MTAPYTVIERDARISDCKAYRYWLKRVLMPVPGQNPMLGGRVVWVMLNPSTADAKIDDATIRRVMGFSFAWGYREIIVVNLFALRSTDPAALWKARDPIGPENDRWISDWALLSEKVVAAWGTNGMHLYRDADVRKLISAQGARLYCLGKTKDGAPKHPVRLAGATVLREFR